MANELAKMPSTGNTIASYLSSDAVRGSIAKVVAEKNADRFVTSIVSAVQANPQLATCTNQSILSAALMGESLQLPPSPQLGYYYLVPYKNNKKIGNRSVEVQEACFQMGWRGMIQLAIRSGQYKNIVVNEIKEGEIEYNPITEDITLHPIMNPAERAKAKTIGYYAAFELISGFKKQMFSPIEAIEAHARQYSKTYKSDLKYGNKRSTWSTNFDAMAKKTMIRMLLSKWGIMSVEMQQAYVNDMSVIDEDGTARYVDNQPETIEERVHQDIAANANSQAFEDAEVIDADDVVEPQPVPAVQQQVPPNDAIQQQAEKPKRGRPARNREAEPATNPAPPEIPKPVIDEEPEIEAFASDDGPEWE
jgi:recombination protein RecT